jgi:hypothetical protein
MTDEAVQRDLGRMESQIASMCSKLDKLDREVEAISSTLSEAKGGWKFLLAVGGMAGTIGSGLTYFFQYFHFGPR